MKLKTILLPLLLVSCIGTVQADEKKAVEKVAKAVEAKAETKAPADSVSKDELREMIRELIQEEMANLQPTSNTESKLVAPAHAAKAGEILAHTCAGCHGTNGVLENEIFMPLAGMPEQEFVKTMLDFRDGARQSTLMGTVANGLSEQQIRDMARYFMEVSP
ncbi:c-type cytochrome [Candidatus Thiothrix anitrata]|uniref:C-type cytochrome n=1 Tax=Candidatus Thiothrix anitrata TaxID=2823902 RepID=A0ABX7X1E3_9GAMM|nr:c-type cytochrome [Candidatus Thiothrix anitrata]QTR49536.1 c-type cytochrome [Candidatus Thiothrix anitrata]